MLSVLAGHRRYAHITTLRCDPVNPPLLGQGGQRGRGPSGPEQDRGGSRLQEQLDYCTRPLLREPWIRSSPDEGISGAKGRDRPEFDQLLKAVVRPKNDVVAACQVNRLGA
jgi:Resolvase, N terminal domain